MSHRGSFAILLLASLTAAGCNRSDRAELAPVTGTVTYDGTPLPSGKIIFETAGARPAIGAIEDGQIVEVTTYELNDGAPVGSHKISIQSVAVAGAGGSGATPTDFNTDPAAYMATSSLIPAKYGNPAKSGLTAEVEPGMMNRFEFELEKE